MVTPLGVGKTCTLGLGARASQPSPRGCEAERPGGRWLWGAQPDSALSRPEDPAVRGRLTECLETILNKAQEPPKSKKVQHSNAKNAVLFEAISLIIHHDRCVTVGGTPSPRPLRRRALTPCPTRTGCLCPAPTGACSRQGPFPPPPRCFVLFPVSELAQHSLRSYLSLRASPVSPEHLLPPGLSHDRTGRTGVLLASLWHEATIRVGVRPSWGCGRAG